MIATLNLSANGRREATMNEIIDTGDVALYEAYDNRYVRRLQKAGR